MTATLLGALTTVALFGLVALTAAAAVYLPPRPLVAFHAVIHRERQVRRAVTDFDREWTELNQRRPPR